jgi:hypothetical protein
MKPSIVKIRKVSKFLEMFVNNARYTVVYFMFEHGKTKAQQENFTLKRQQRI